LAVAEHHTPVARKLQSGRDRGRNRLGEDTDLTPPHSAVGADLVVHEANDVARSREANPLAATRLTEDQRIDPDHGTIGGHQWPSAVAGIDRCVGLDVDHPVLIAKLPAYGADHTHGDTAGESERTAECQHYLTRRE